MRTAFMRLPLGGNARGSAVQLGDSSAKLRPISIKSIIDFINKSIIYSSAVKTPKTSFPCKLLVYPETVGLKARGTFSNGRAS